MAYLFEKLNLAEYPGLNANEIQIPYDKHYKVSSLVKSYQYTNNFVKYEVLENSPKKARALIG